MITAYTRSYNKIVDRLIVRCYLSLPVADFSAESGPLDALLDTGAMSTCNLRRKHSDNGADADRGGEQRAI